VPNVIDRFSPNFLKNRLLKCHALCDASSSQIASFARGNGLMKGSENEECIGRTKTRIVTGINSAFPIQVPDRLPAKIEPCPILEAIAEVRFVTTVPEQGVVGMVYAQLRERYPDLIPLPLSAFPIEARAANPSLLYQPAVQFHSKEFIIQVGSRVAGLAIKPKQYPGWTRMREEVVYLLGVLAKAAFISEAERLAIRYVNFLEENVFEKIKLDVLVENQPYRSHEMAIITTFVKDAATARLSVANNAVATIEGKRFPGSLLDIDVWFSSVDFDLFQLGLQKFDEAHVLLKQIFFGLLTPEFLSSLNPIYSPEK
jgi:uncharacterized protein (TIGR04255 family)